MIGINTVQKIIREATRKYLKKSQYEPIDSKSLISMRATVNNALYQSMNQGIITNFKNVECKFDNLTETFSIDVTCHAAAVLQNVNVNVSIRASDIDDSDSDFDEEEFQAYLENKSW